MILISGESLIDMLPVVQGGRRQFLPVPGGSPYNVSLALGRLGLPVKFLGRFSEDPFGQMLVRTLEESHVNLSLCPRTPALSTVGFVTFDGKRQTPSYAFYTKETAGCGLEPGDIPAVLPPEIRCLHFGSISLVLEPIGQTLEKLLALKSQQTLVSVDPNIRPFMVGNRDSFLRRLNCFLGQADLIKLSDEDLAWLHPGLSAQECCRKYVAQGAGLVVVTRGGKGALAMNPQGVVEVPAESVQVVDTVGAGDTFQAALLAWMQWEHGLKAEALRALEVGELEELLAFAAKAAAITCSRAGCNPPWKHELDLKTAFGVGLPVSIERQA